MVSVTLFPIVKLYPDAAEILVFASRVIASAIESQSMVSVTNSEFEISTPNVEAIVTVSVALTVVVIPVPDAIVTVSPDFIV